MRSTLMRIIGSTVSVLVLALSSGCANQPKATELDQARDALVTRDFDTAQSSAETYLARNPTGTRVAEAHYLKGRALEDRPAPTAQAARDNLQNARAAYIAALKANPTDTTLEGLIRASLADVAYWQEDFAVAADQGLAAYPLLTDDTTRAWTLYRAAVSQQRAGQFDQADRTLAMVQQNHPGTEPAQRAASRVGVRGFNVQVATFMNPGSADAAVASLSKQGMAAFKKPAAANRIVVMVGPYASYQQAAGVRLKVATTYPDALIVP